MVNNKTVVFINGVFDPFHIGHLNLIRNAKVLGDILIVGVAIDERARNRGKTPIIPYEQRAEIVRSIRDVDLVIPMRLNDKHIDMVRNMKIDLVVYGDDYVGKESGDNITGVPTIYFPYTEEISSSRLKEKICLESKQKVQDPSPLRNKVNPKKENNKSNE